MTIDSIEFSLPELYSGITKDYPFGNMGDLQRMRICFTLTSSLSSDKINVYFMLKEKDFNQYPNSIYDSGLGTLVTDTVLPDDFFYNAVTQDLQVWSGDVSRMNPQTPKRWQQFTAASLALIGGNQYDFTLDFYLTDFVSEEDKIGTTYNRSRSLAIKPIFKIERVDSLNPNIAVETTNTTNLSTFQKNGSIGTLGQFLGTASTPFYTLESISPAQLDTNNATTYTAVLVSSNGSFTSTTKLFLCALRIVDYTDLSNFDSSQTFTQNIGLEKVTLLANNTEVNTGTNLKKVKAVVNVTPTKINFTFQVAANAYPGDYCFFVAVSNNDSAINHNNILLQLNTADTAATDTEITLQPLPGANGGNIRFNYHDQNDIGQSFDHVTYAHIESPMIVRLRLSNAEPSTSKLVSFSIGLRRKIDDTENNDIWIERYDIFASQLPVDSPKTFKYAGIGDVKLTRTCTESSPGVFDFDYGFIIWEDLIDFTDLIFACVARFEKILPGGNVVTIEKYFRSPVFEMVDYSINQNTAAFPQVKFKELVLRDNATNAVIQGILIDGDTRVTYIFEDKNIVTQSLQASAADLAGFLGIELEDGGLTKYYQLHSVFNGYTPSPWIPVSGVVGQKSKITVLDTKTCQIEGVLSYSKLLTAMFGDISQESKRKAAKLKFCVSANITKIQPSDFAIRSIDFHLRTPDLTYAELQITEPLTSISIEEISGTLPVSSLVFQYSTNNTEWANPATEYSFNEWGIKLANALPGDYIRIRTNATGFIDGGVILSYYVFVSTVTPTTLTFIQPINAIDAEEIIWLDKKTPTDNFVISSFSADNTGLTFISLRTSNISTNYNTDFIVYSPGNISVINSQIAALPAGAKYGIHVGGFRNSLSTSTWSLSGSYSDVSIQKREFKSHVGSYLNPRWGLDGSKMCWSGDGVNDHITVPVIVADSGVSKNMNVLIQPTTNYAFSFWANIRNDTDFAIFQLDTIFNGNFYIGFTSAYAFIGLYKTFGSVGFYKYYNMANIGLGWKNITASYMAASSPSPSNFKIYINGVSLDTITTSLIVNTEASFGEFNSARIASEPTVNTHYRAVYSDFIFVKKEITDLEAKEIYYARGDRAKYPSGIISNRVIDFSLNQSSSAVLTVTDQSGNDNNGTIAGQSPTSFSLFSSFN